MFGRLFHKCGVAALLAVGIVGLLVVSPALGQTFSNADTMRILDVGGLPGDTVIVDFFLRNSVVLGGYAFRLRYDPSLIEPLTDTVIFDTTWVYHVEVQEVRGTSFEAHGGYIRSPGEMVFTVVDLLHAPYSPDTTFYLPGRAVALRLRWRVVPGTAVQMVPITFENDPKLPWTWNVVTDLSGNLMYRPVMLPGSVSILSPDCSSQGDVNDNGLPYEVGDVVRLLSYTFSCGNSPPKDPACARVNRGDITCDGVVDVFDVVKMCDIVAGEYPPAADGCN